MGPKAASPCCAINSKTSVVRPAAGPLTESGEPAKRAGQDAADNTGDDAARGWCTAGDGDAETQWERHEKN